MRKHPNSHREAKATAPVLDSTRYYAQNPSMSEIVWLEQLRCTHAQVAGRDNLNSGVRWREPKWKEHSFDT
jgi:hypothetical protein